MPSSPPIRVPARAPAAARRARLANAAVFALHATVFGSWAPHIPLVMDRIGLNEGTLGLALLGAPAGSIAAVALVGTLLARFGSRPVMVVTMLGYAAAGPLVGMAATLGQLFSALVLLGAFMAALDVAMNTQAVAVEAAYGRPIMSSFHAVWAAGAATGSGIGIGALALGVDLAPQLLVLGAVLALSATVLTPPLLDEHSVPGGDDRVEGTNGAGEVGAAGPGRGLPWREPRLWVIAGIMFAALLCEGAASDWASVYLRDSLGTPETLAGLGYSVFAVAMFVGRACGDRWVARFGGARVVGVLAGTGAVALASALLLHAPWAALAGLAVYGLGLSCLVPVSLSAAAVTAQRAGGHTGHALAAVDGAGRVGFLLGPPAIGALAYATSLPVGLAVLPVLCAGVVVGGRALRDAG